MGVCDRIPPEEIALTATTLALALTKDKDAQEIQSLINLFNLTQQTMIAIIAQKSINEKALQIEDISII